MARAWLLAFSRPVAAAEAEQALDFLRRHGYETSALSAKEAVLADFCLALFNANEFVYLD